MISAVTLARALQLRRRLGTERIDEGPTASQRVRSGPRNCRTQRAHRRPRRVPHVERLGEIRIAREAATLRKGAVTRIDELKSAALGQHTRDAELSDAVIADDGGPTRKDEERRRASALESRTLIDPTNEPHD